MGAMTFRCLPALAAMAAACVSAQSVEVYSEFQRVDPFGRTLAADRAQTPREILSPLLARNAHFTFQAVVRVPRGETYTVFLAQNPENAVRVAAYRPVYVNRGGVWIPDELKPLDLAPDGRVPEIPLQVAGQSVRTLWVDLWVEPHAEVRRTRLEVQLRVGGNWIIYPMELRTHELVAPPASWPLEPLAAVEASAAESAAAPWRALACGAEAAAAGAEGPMSVRRLIRRNARQDVAFARALAGKNGKAETLAEIFGAVKLDPARWCKAAAPPPRELGAEWYLRLRQSIYRRAELSD
jgi:hypothetical protein